MFRLLAGVVGAFMVVLALLFFTGPGQEHPVVGVNFGERESGAASMPLSPPEGILRVAVASVLSPKETANSYQEMLNYIGARLGRPTQLVQRKTYAETNELVKTGYAVLAFVCGGAYIEGRNEFGMELLAAPQFNGKAVYHSYIIVPKDSPVQSFEELRGKTFAFSDPLSNSGRLFPAYRLAQMGETPESFFQKYFFTYSHDNSIRAVAEKLVDGAAVDSLVYNFTVANDSPLIAATRIIEVSPPYPVPPVVVPPDLDPSLKEELRQLLLNMHEDEEGRGVLRKLMIDRFVTIPDSAYDVMRAMREVVGGPKSGP